MKNNTKQITEVKGISGVNRNLDVVYEDSKIRDKVIGLALMNYIDGSQGFELVVVRTNGAIGIISENKFEVVEVEPKENVYISPGPIYENDDNPFVNRNAEQFDGEDVEPDNSITRIQTGSDGALCQCQNGLDFNNCPNSGAITDFHCWGCESDVKMRACIHNTLYYDCPFCGYHLT